MLSVTLALFNGTIDRFEFSCVLLDGNDRRSPYNFTTGDQSASEMSGCIVQLPIKVRYRVNASSYSSPQRSF